MADKKPKIQKCKVLRAFWLDGKTIEAGKTVDLEEPFATEMKASLKVEFVGKDAGDVKDEKK